MTDQPQCPCPICEPCRYKVEPGRTSCRLCRRGYHKSTTTLAERIAKAKQ